MTKIVSKLALSAAALVLSAGLALAQTAAPAPSAPTAPAATPAPDAAAKAPSAKKGPPVANQKKPTTPEGIECTAQADAKNLHGKERQAFRRKCVAEIKKAKGAPAKKG